MNFLELVKNRCSCRAYKSINVEKEKTPTFADVNNESTL